MLETERIETEATAMRLKIIPLLLLAASMVACVVPTGSVFTTQDGALRLQHTPPHSGLTPSPWQLSPTFTLPATTPVTPKLSHSQHTSIPDSLPARTILPRLEPSHTINPTTPETVRSTARFQVFILNPVRTCLVGNDFASGDVCVGTNCSDCDCTWEQFDPPAPLVGVPPERVDDPQYASFEHKICLEISLTQSEADAIIADMELVSQQVYEWSGGALDLQMEFTVLPHTHTGFVAPDFVFGPFEVDDELLNPYVSQETDFVYVVTGVYDRSQGTRLAYACGGSYGEMSVHGAGYANIQYNDLCNSVQIAGREVYEPLIHEWFHNLDWALYNLNGSKDIYEGGGPDWARWKPGDWPACNSGPMNAYAYFPSIDLCEWDPDWRDCNNVASAGACLHAGEVDGQDSWYEHVLAAHYPRDTQFNGNLCQDGRMDYGETEVDSGGPCH